MADGIGLSVTLYLPDPAGGPQPCILEALPYRKDDMTSSYRPEYVRLRDEYRYAVARLDLRGTGSSDTLDYSASDFVGANLIDGGAGRDTITGSAGNDIIVGGATLFAARWKPERSASERHLSMRRPFMPQPKN